MVPTWLLRVQAGPDMPTAHAVLARHHLSDHPAGAVALEPCMAPGTALGPLLVLERLEVRLANISSERHPDQICHLTDPYVHLLHTLQIAKPQARVLYVISSLQKRQPQF